MALRHSPTSPNPTPKEGKPTMPIKLQLIVLALVGPLFATGVCAYDNCDTLRYNNRAGEAQTLLAKYGLNQ